MIRAKEIQEKLLHLVGWQQDYNATGALLCDSITQSESGLYFQQAHPLLTIDTIKSIAPDFTGTIYPEYLDSKEYKAGDIVDFNGISFKALQSSVGLAPDAASEYWSQTDPFSEWLEQKTKASIQKAIMQYCNSKVNNGTYKALCENKTLFDGTGRLADTIKNQNNIVGFEIVPIRAKGVVTKINRIGLQFTEPGTYTIYLMHSSQNAPVKTVQLVKQAKNSLEWFTLDDWHLPYVSDLNDAGGSWYLCYFQSELPENSKAIRKERDWSKGPCRACSPREFSAWQAWSKYLEIHPFYVNEELLSAPEVNEPELIVKMWGLEYMQYDYATNYGINLDITVSCDITDFIIEQRMLFQDIISKQVAVDMLREFAFNPNVRVNRQALNASRMDILYELDGDSSSLKKSGLVYQLEQAFNAVKLSTEGLDRVCLPCKNNGVKYRTI